MATETAKELESLLGGSVFSIIGVRVYRFLIDINIAAVCAMGRFFAY